MQAVRAQVQAVRVQVLAVCRLWRSGRGKEEEAEAEVQPDACSSGVSLSLQSPPLAICLRSHVTHRCLPPQPRHTPVPFAATEAPATPTGSGQRARPCSGGWRRWGRCRLGGEEFV